MTIIKSVQTTLIVAALFAFSSLVIAGQKDNERIEVPVYSRNVPFLDMTVGSSGPLSMFIDTGAGGIRIHPGNVKDADVAHTGSSNKIMYGDGNTGIEGEVVLGKVRIGDFVVPGKTPFQAISKHVCKDGYEDRCEREGSKHGGAGTIGLATFHYSDLGKKERKKDSPIFNPLIQQGPFAYILKVPRNDNEKGSLIINPTQQEKSRFTLIRLAPGSGQRIPICINRYCFEGILDTGTVGNNIPIATQIDERRLGLPVDDDKIAEGTTIPITLGEGRNSLSIKVTAGKKAAKYRLKDKDNGRGLLGIDIFRYIDVLYDFDAGVIGVAKKSGS
jgi:hypothetical protein